MPETISAAPPSIQAVTRSLEILTDPMGLGLGARHITISTVGHPKQIRQLAEMDHQWNLAISLHAPNDTLRQQLVPTSQGIAPLLEAARDFYEKTGREITFEYCLVKGVNDGPMQARELGRRAEDVSFRAPARTPQNHLGSADTRLAARRDSSFVGMTRLLHAAVSLLC